jgi:hypothetical protein
VNPRAVNHGRDVLADLRIQLSDLRTHRQRILAQSATARSVVVTKKHPVALPALSGGGTIAHPLGAGAHAGVPLNYPSADWSGRADLIQLDHEACEITDFKTGSQKEDHQLQLQAYAWLWFNDVVKNPARKRATDLQLVYSGGTVPVPAPSLAELDVTC